MGDKVLFDSWCDTGRFYAAKYSHLCSVCLFPPRTVVLETPPSPRDGTGVDPGSRASHESPCQFQGSRQGEADALTQDDTLTSRLRRRAARKVRRRVHENKKVITVLPRDDAERIVNECRYEFITSV